MRFYVNVDHVATLREARKTTEPNPTDAAFACLDGGADGITVHLREDRRHIQDHDVRELTQRLPCPLNFELASAPEVVEVLAELKPHQATFVPERREEITTEGGLDLTGDTSRLERGVHRLKQEGIRISFFIDPVPESIKRSVDLGADAVELHTGTYANRAPDHQAELDAIERAAEQAGSLGLAVHAGHGLTMDNVTPIAAIQAIEELSIGHHLVSRSVFVGLTAAVRAMRERLQMAR